MSDVSPTAIRESQNLARSAALELRRNLRASICDASGYFLMVGIGETYFAAYALASGAGEVAAGLIATVPLLAGALVQLLSPWGVQRLRSHRSWTVGCAAVQAASFVPLAIGSAFGTLPVWLVYALVSLYWAGGLGAGSAWNTWISTLVPVRLRQRYFARRTHIGQPFVLLGMLAGGFALNGAHDQRTAMQIFALMFAVAGAARFVSAFFLSRQTEPHPLPPGHRKLALREVPARLLRTADGRLILYLLAMQLGVYVASPFFNPYLLRQLQLEHNYGLYALLYATPYVTRMAGLWIVQRFAGRWTPAQLLWTGSLGVMPLAALWMFATNIPYIFGVQAVAGLAWAVYELAMLLMFFHAIRADERTSLLTYYSFLNSAALVAGSFLGGALLHGLGETPQTYWLVFGISSALRLMAFPLLRLATAPQPVAGGKRRASNAFSG